MRYLLGTGRYSKHCPRRAHGPTASAQREKHIQEQQGSRGEHIPFRAVPATSLDEEGDNKILCKLADSTAFPSVTFQNLHRRNNHCILYKNKDLFVLKPYLCGYRPIYLSVKHSHDDFS